MLSVPIITYELHIQCVHSEREGDKIMFIHGEGSRININMNTHDHQSTSPLDYSPSLVTFILALAGERGEEKFELAVLLNISFPMEASSLSVELRTPMWAFLMLARFAAAFSLCAASISMRLDYSGSIET
jgi:hypothetical protein